MKNKLLEKKSPLFGIVEESSYMANACEMFVIMTDKNTPGRDTVLKIIKNYQQRVFQQGGLNG